MANSNDTHPCILVTGSRGQLGQSIFKLRHEFSDFRFLFTDRSSLDLTSEPDILAFLSGHPSIRFCINCAAYTAVDKAEQEAEAAWKANAAGPGYLAAACADSAIPLIHLSSDYVYHNDNNVPLRETDATQPKGIYAQTKLQGEQLVRQHHPDGTLIVRTSWVYAPWGHNFVRTMLRIAQERPAVSVVCDQVGTPTYAPDLAMALLRILRDLRQGTRDISALAGIYNFSNEGVASWYDVAAAVFRMKGIDTTVRPIPTVEFPTPAQRPPYSILDKSKFKSVFGQVIPHWQDSLAQCLRQL
jgi:dTDP-4-dehydrorhamnose reductase